MNTLPIRNVSTIAAYVYSHSGEFSLKAIDFTIPGRGLSFSLTRNYRSEMHNLDGPFGFGWMSSYAQCLKQKKNVLIYRDGVGRTHDFKTTKSGFKTPDGLYAIIENDGKQLILVERYGNRLRFEAPEEGGRLLAIEDRNKNSLRFEYSPQAIIITESMGRRISWRVADGHVVEVEDYTGRTWQYRYDKRGCLVEVTQPPGAEGFRASIQYTYDDEHRLVTSTNACGRKYLENLYNTEGRVTRQRHGKEIFSFVYKKTSKKGPNGEPILITEVLQKNNARLVLKHDYQGHVVRRSLFVSSDTLSSPDREDGEKTALITLSKFNRHGELVYRCFPAGNAHEYRFDENAKDPRQRGNVQEFIRHPVRGAGDKSISTIYEYEPDFQHRASIKNALGRTIRFKYDAQGNLKTKVYPAVTIQEIGKNDPQGKIDRRCLEEHFDYNTRGQIIRVVNARGAVTEFHYYPENDCGGAKEIAGASCDPKCGGGYLARIVRDAQAPDRRVNHGPATITTEFVYDQYGNPKVVRDGKGQQTRYECDAMCRLLRFVTRKGYEVRIRHDVKRNRVDAEIDFERNVVDDKSGLINRVSSTIRTIVEFDDMKRAVRKIYRAGGREFVEIVQRDASGNIIRRIEPEETLPSTFMMSAIF